MWLVASVVWSKTMFLSQRRPLSPPSATEIATVSRTWVHPSDDDSPQGRADLAVIRNRREQLSWPMIKETILPLEALLPCGPQLQGSGNVLGESRPDDEVLRRSLAKCDAQRNSDYRHVAE